MIVFNNYARYYDLLNQGKDYKAEARYVHDLLKKHLPACASVLELGCGTGGHAEHLASLGFDVYGIDLSQQMLEQANARVKNLPQALAKKITFEHGDVRNVRLNKKFDAVISLFHVFSYQTTDGDLQSTFATAKEHLKPGGVLLFDCWYGPGVLADRPATRDKKLEDDTIVVHRHAQSEMDLKKNRVDVNYTINITNKADGLTEEIKETHGMRYLFLPEIKTFCTEAGLDYLDGLEWLSSKKPTDTSWTACFLARG